MKLASWRAAAALLLASHARPSSGWCCRACGKCMCSSYGVCPAMPPSVPPLNQNLDEWSVGDVGKFVGSLAVNGSRARTCPDGCELLRHFEAERFERAGVTGKRLASIVHGHEHRFIYKPGAQKNVTERKAHASWLETHGLLPPGLSSEQHLAFYTRLKDALRQEVPLPAGAYAARKNATRRRMNAVAGARTERKGGRGSRRRARG